MYYTVGVKYDPVSIVNDKKNMTILFLVLDCHFGVKFNMDAYINLAGSIQTSLISVYTHWNLVDMLELGLNI